MDSSTHQLQMTQIRHRIDALMDLLYGAGVASHHTIIEQINYLMFLRALTKRDDEAIKIDNADKMLFTGGFAKYRWDNLLMLNAEELFTTLEKIYRELPTITSDSTIALLYRDAHVKIYEKPTLRRLLHEIEKLMSELEADAKQGSKDIFGDMYEYLLSKQSQAGTMGQFRTPRHIIKFIAEIVDPQKGETILDPACGTAGFLVSAFKVLQEKYTSEKFKEGGRYPLDLLDPKDRKFIYENAFTGFDSDADMIKFGLMNLYLHQLEHPQIIRQNTLVDTAGNRDKWNIILANPPFSGALDKDSISEDLRMGTRATEILFLRYMIDHLKDNGRAGVIVPEGIIFSSSTAHKKIRQLLVDESGLWCVVSLPAGIFNPYAGVKTSILFFDKSLKEKAKDILFVKIENDGFDLGAQKRPIDKNDLPQAEEEILRFKQLCHSGLDPESIQREILKQVQDDKKITIVSKEKIAESGDYNLSSDRYKIETIIGNQKWPMVELGTLFDMVNGRAFKKEEWGTEGLPIIRIANLNNENEGFNFFRGSYDKKILVEKGDLLFSWSGTKGTSFGPHLWNRQLGLLNQHIYKFNPRQKINLSFAYYMISSIVPDIEEQAHGAGGLVHITKEKLIKFKIPLPPLEIQQQIVGELEGYQKIISGAKQVVENWKPEIKFDSSWTIKKLGELTEQKIQSGFAITKADIVQSGNTKFVNIFDIYQGYEIKVASLPYINEGKYQDKYLQRGDILFVRVSLKKEGAAYTSVYNSENKNVVYGDNILRLRLTKEVDSTFLNYLLRTDIYRQKILRICHTANVTSINTTNLGNFEVALPSIDSQKEIVEKIEEERKIVEVNKKLIEIYEQKIKSKIAEVWGE